MARADQQQSRLGALQTGIQIALVVAIFAAIQFLASRHNQRFDLTPDQRFVLSPYARQAANAFAEDATLYVFYDSQQVVERRRMLDLLEQFHMAAPNLRYELIDLDRKPGLAKKYKVSTYGSATLELANGRRYPVRSVTERGLTSTLLRLSRTRQSQVCFATRHGSGDPRDQDQRSGLSKLGTAIQNEGFAISTLASPLSSESATECTVVIWIAPTRELADGEAASIDAYVREGGRVLFLLDPGAPKSFDQFLRTLGVDVGTNIIVDEDNRMLGADSFVPQVDRFRQEIFGDRLRAATILPVARTVRATGDRPVGVRVISLAGTSDSSWARTNTAEVPSQSVRFRPDADEPGPLSIAVRANVDRGADQTPGQVIVVGDSDFVTNDHLNTLGNRDFALALIGVLAEDPLVIGSRQSGRRDAHTPLVLNAAQTRTIFWVAVVILPGICVLAGILLAATRRRQRGGR